MLTSSEIQHQQHIETKIAHGKLNEAHQLLVSKIKNTPNDHFSYFLLGQVNLAAGDTPKAQKLLEKAVSITEHPLYIAHLAKIAVLTGQLISAQQHIDKVLNSSFDEAIFCDLVANVLTRLGHYQAALSWQKKAFAAAPDNAQIAYNLAVGYKVMARFEQARLLLQQLIEKQPTHFQAHYSLAELNDNSTAPAHLAKLNRLISNNLDRPSLLNSTYCV